MKLRQAKKIWKQHIKNGRVPCGSSWINAHKRLDKDYTRRNNKRNKYNTGAYNYD